jgi:Zn-dependent membrane protease YugP
MGIYLILGVFMLISWLVSMRLKSKFNEYSQVSFRGNLTGAQIAAKMLADSGISDVKILSVEGATNRPLQSGRKNSEPFA